MCSGDAGSRGGPVSLETAPGCCAGTLHVRTLRVGTLRVRTLHLWMLRVRMLHLWMLRVGMLRVRMLCKNAAPWGTSTVPEQDRSGIRHNRTGLPGFPSSLVFCFSVKRFAGARRQERGVQQ